MPSHRKLFLIHASELSHRLVRTVGQGGLISQFLLNYAQRHNRPGLLMNPERVHDLIDTIGREALLVMTSELKHVIPNAFAQTRSGALKPDEAVLAATFYAEFLQSLGRSLEWPEVEAADLADTFRRDLEIYERWVARFRSRPGAPSKTAPSEDSPFSDRCALLLDPGMMEQARRAAAEFEIEVARLAARTFSQLGRRAPAARASRPRPVHRARPQRPRRRSIPRAKARPARRKRRPKPRKPRKPGTRRTPGRKPRTRRKRGAGRAAPARRRSVRARSLRQRGRAKGAARRRPSIQPRRRPRRRRERTLRRRR